MTFKKPKKLSKKQKMLEELIKKRKPKKKIRRFKRLLKPKGIEV